MSGFHQVTIGGYPTGGLMTDRKPLMLANEAYSKLQNAYVWRERTKKRDGTVTVGRLRRFFSNASIGNSGASPWTFNIYSSLTGQAYFPIIPETYAEISEGSVVITITTLATSFTDNGDGTLSNTTPGNSGTINYLTGSVTLTTTVGAGHATTISFGYYPALPVMGELKQDVAQIGIDNTLYFDTKYAYQYTGGNFQELVIGETWSGSNTDFFWSANYQGATPDQRYFFTTNDNITLGMASPYDPIRYYTGSVWTDLKPLLSSTTTLFQSLIIIPYFGRLLALNTWEGTTAGGQAGATNFFARCRFSQVGNPIAADSWRSDLFGLGGFIDAPTNEAIVSAAFYRNTLIVFFEYSTWQLRYIGEYGLPFIFERISSDFGSSSTYSSILFDQGVMTVSDRGVITAGASGIERLDEQIPETVFSFEIQNHAPNFVHGIRDYEKEVVYWNYVDTTNSLRTQQFPNTTLLFNYRNNTWAQFRDTITCFGIAQFQFGITWDSLSTLWDSDVSWDTADDQQYVDYVVTGNQQGFVQIYENPEAATNIADVTNFGPSLAIYAVNLSNDPTIFTVPNHNLNNGEFIYLTGMLWNGSDPGFNNKIYKVLVYDPVQASPNYNQITLSQYNQNTGDYTPLSSSSMSTYIGGGEIALLPVMNIVGKDFSPFQQAGKGFKLSYIDFQVDSIGSIPSVPALSVQLFVNSYLGEQANLYGNREVQISAQNSGEINFATNANPCLVTSDGHSLHTDDLIYISGVQGMTQLNQANYNITVVDADHFTLQGIDSTGFGVYSNSGIWNSIPSEGQVYIPGSQYAWYRFYSTQYGQYLRIAITYDDLLMNQLSTHQTPVEINGMNIFFREGGRLINS